MSQIDMTCQGCNSTNAATEVQREHIAFLQELVAKRHEGYELLIAELRKERDAAIAKLEKEREYRIALHVALSEGCGSYYGGAEYSDGQIEQWQNLIDRGI